jgi:cell division protein FtsW
LFDREKLNGLYKWWLAIDKTVYILTVLLIMLGMIFVGVASPIIARRLEISSDLFIKKQFVFAFASVFVISFISIFNTKQIKLISIAGMLFCLVLLIITILFGFSIKGSKRWIYLFGVSLQPTEILKPFFIMTNAYLLSFFYKENHIKQLIIASIPFLIVSGLILLQPDVGSIILLAILFAVQLFIAGIPIIYFLTIGFAGVIFVISTYMFIPHVTGRINRFIASFLSFEEANYQVTKSLQAYWRGGLLGRGPLEGAVKNSIPDAHTDFIFAVIGEEFGLFFCFILLCILFYITLRILLKISKEKDNFKFLAVSGLISQFILQSVINIGVTLNLLPTKGMTLPFISYGGSSMLGMAINFGIILALTKNTYKEKRKVSEVILENV